MKSLANVLTSAGQGLDVLRLIRGPFLVSIFAALILCLPDQTREVYRIVAENWVAGSEGAGFKIFVTSVFLVVVTLGVWVSTIDIASHQQQLSRAEDAGWFKRAMLVILPLLPALLIPVGLAIGLLWAASELEAAKFPAAVLNELPKLKTILDRLEEPVQVLERAFLGSLAVAGAMAVIHLTYVSLGPTSSTKVWMRALSFRIRVIAILMIAIITTALIAIFPLEFPQLVGALFIFLNFVLVLTLITSILTATFDRFKIPVITILLLVALGLSVSGVNDNHTVQPIKRSDKTPKSLGLVSGFTSIKDSVFIKWLEARGDLKHYTEKGQPYPVFVVAAAGGELSAAAHTVAVLSRLQDRCPNFAQHVFAISGVSGGSIGAAVFSGLVRDAEQAKNAPWQPCIFGPMDDADRVLENKARAFLKYDFLAPLTGALLFPDFLQRFLPYPFPVLDRARALENSFEKAWTTGIDQEKANPFKMFFSDLWDPNDAAPALLLNMTDVDNGLRVVATPFGLQHFRISYKFEDLHKYTTLINLYSFAGWQKDTKILSDIKLSTAVSLSARFPWVLPAATLRRASDSDEEEEPPVLRLVDGGYFENSGAETAVDVVHQLARYFVITKEKEDRCSGYSDLFEDKEKRKNVPEICRNYLHSKKTLEEANAPLGVKIHLMLINVNPGLKAEPWFGGSELLSPLLGLMSTREMRGQLANFRATIASVPCWDEIGEWTECDPWLASHMTLDPSYYHLPLGWYISPITLDFIAFHSGRADRSNVPSKWKWNESDSYKAHLSVSDKTACAVQLILRGDAYADWEKVKYNADLRPCMQLDAPSASHTN